MPQSPGLWQKFRITLQFVGAQRILLVEDIAFGVVRGYIERHFSLSIIRPVSLFMGWELHKILSRFYVVYNLILPVLFYLQVGCPITHSELSHPNLQSLICYIYYFTQHRLDYIKFMQKSCKIKRFHCYYEFQAVSSFDRKNFHNIMKSML